MLKGQQRLIPVPLYPSQRSSVFDPRRLDLAHLVATARAPCVENPNPKPRPVDARRGHGVPLGRLEGVCEAPDTPDIELVAERERTHAIASTMNS